MTDQISWGEIKRQRSGSEGRRRGYEAAKEAFELGVHVREARERAGLTQAELARRMRTSQPAVARLEAGSGAPSIDTLRRAADALGFDLVIEFRERVHAS